MPGMGPKIKWFWTLNANKTCNRHDIALTYTQTQIEDFESSWPSMALQNQLLVIYLIYKRLIFESLFCFKYNQLKGKPFDIYF